MSLPLHLLMVEDSEDDAALLVRELRRGGSSPHSPPRLVVAQSMIVSSFGAENTVPAGIVQRPLGSPQPNEYETSAV